MVEESNHQVGIALEQAPVVAPDNANNSPHVDAAKALVETCEAKNETKEEPKDVEDRERGDRRSRSPRRTSRSRSRDRRRRSRSREHRRRRSRSRDRRRRRSNSRRRYRSRRDYSSEEDYRGGRSGRSNRRGTSDKTRMATVEDPFAHLRTAATTTTDPAEIARQMQEQQLRSRQLVLQQQAASAIAAASKTQREVYVGNLVAGVVTEPMLRELFRTTLVAAFPDKCKDGQDPVIHINMAAEGKYCFIELLSAEMAAACLALTGQVPLMGSMLSIGRPAGYVDPVKAQAASLSAAEALARFQAESQAARLEAGLVTEETMAKEETTFLCVDGMLTAEVLCSDQEYAEVLSDVREECERHGAVLRVVAPRPEDPSTAAEVCGTGPYGKVYVQFLDPEGAQKARAAMDGRMFAGQTIKAVHMQAKDFMVAVGQTG